MNCYSGYYTLISVERKYFIILHCTESTAVDSYDVFKITMVLPKQRVFRVSRFGLASLGFASCPSGLKFDFHVCRYIFSFLTVLM